jgi:hypothetical protein
MSEVSHALSSAQKTRDIEMKDLRTTTMELVEMSDAEKQKIVMQISAVQTELQGLIDKRYVRSTMGESEVHRKWCLFGLHRRHLRDRDLLSTRFVYPLRRLEAV